MSDSKKRFSPTLRNIYKKQHGARPCVEKMQLIFIVPPNEELEGYIAPSKSENLFFLSDIGSDRKWGSL
jgi:hypothetical protein